MDQGKNGTLSLLGTNLVYTTSSTEFLKTLWYSKVKETHSLK